MAVQLPSAAAVTECCGCAVRDHEAGVEAAALGEESGQLTVGRIHQPFDAPFTHTRHFMHADRQVIARLTSSVNQARHA